MPDPFVSEERRSKDDDDDDDVFHFVSFVPIRGKVYELDGLKSAPVLIGEIPEGKVGLLTFVLWWLHGKLNGVDSGRVLVSAWRCGQGRVYGPL